ncbi:MAG: zinc-ribbon domain-containing protein [Magnetococcales bacterium]|nr:zinc-ribbon domain-containing protein [Magnetococcales bacterium]
MIVQCESCRSQFDVDDAILRPSGRKLKCSQCAAVFFQPPPKGDAPRATPAPQSHQEPPAVLKKLPDEEFAFLDADESVGDMEADLAESEDLFVGEEVDDGLDGLDEIPVDDIFGEALAGLEQEEREQEKAAGFLEAIEPVVEEDPLAIFSDAFGPIEAEAEEEEEVAKDGLITTYMRETDTPPPPPAPGFVPPVVNAGDDEETMVGPGPKLALAKPTARELEMMRLAQERLAKKVQEPSPEPTPAPEPPSAFIKMEEAWDTGEAPVEDVVDADAEEQEEPEAPPVKWSKTIKFLMLFLMLALGLGLATLTDWWTFKRYDWFSAYRLTAAHGEWRRYPFGSLLLISGAVSNTDRLTQLVPGIRVVLLSQEGKELGTGLAYPGRVIPDKILDESSESALRSMALLQGEDKKLKMNRILPGNSMDYQVIFLKPPSEAARFRLELLPPEGKSLAGGKAPAGKESALPGK